MVIERGTDHDGVAAYGHGAAEAGFRGSVVRSDLCLKLSDSAIDAVDVD
jgi:hypothetical protein